MGDDGAVIRLFLGALQDGDWDAYAARLAPDVVYDASVPGWRHRMRGREDVAGELRGGWTGTHLWRVAEAIESATPDGALVELELRGRCPGDADHPAHDEACRMANVFAIRDGLVVAHRVYCSGEYDEETTRRIDAQTTSTGGGA